MISDLIYVTFTDYNTIIVFVNGLRLEYDLNKDKLVTAELVEFRINNEYRRQNFINDLETSHFEMFVRKFRDGTLFRMSNINPLHYSVLADLSLDNEVAIKDVKSNSEFLHSLCVGKSSKKHFGETFGDEIKINTALRGDVPVFETDFAELEKRAKNAITK